MKKTLFAFLFAFISLYTFAQNDLSCRTVNLSTPEDIVTAETCILQFANTILSSPVAKTDDRDIETLKGLAYIFSWMEKTEYSFVLNGEVSKLTKGGKNGLFEVYLAAMTKAAIENKAVSPEKAILILADFIKNPNMKVKQNGAVKAFLSDVEAGNLAKYI